MEACTYSRVFAMLVSVGLFDENDVFLSEYRRSFTISSLLSTGEPQNELHQLFFICCIPHVLMIDETNNDAYLDHSPALLAVSCTVDNFPS